MRTVQRIVLSALLGLACLPLHGRAAENLCTNGDFSVVHTNGLPAGWVCDFAWMGRSHWRHNERYIRVVEREGTKRNVLAMVPGTGGDEATISSAPIPFDPDARYVITFEGRTEGPQPRIYVRGYKWKSGVRPHAAPQLGELQNMYRGKPFDALTGRWQRFRGEFPFASRKKVSDLRRDHLRRIRFIVFYVTIPVTAETKSLYIDNVTITRQ